MQDPRYKKLRENLDRMKFLEHLGIDSVDLVQKIFNEHIRLIQTFNKLKKKTNSAPKVQSENYEHQMDLLNQKYGQLKQENEKLKKKLQDNGIQQKIVTLQSALNSCRAKYQKRLDQMNEKVANYEIQMQQLIIGKNSLSQQNSRIRVMLEKSKLDHENTSIQLTSILDKKKKQIQRLEQQGSKFRLQINSLQRIYNQQKQLKSSSQMEVDKKASLALQVLKQQLKETEQKVNSYRKLLQDQKQKNNQLKKTIQILTQKIAKLKSQEDYAKSSYHIQTNAKQKYQVLYADSQKKIQEYKERIQKIEKEKDQKDIYISRLNQQIKDLKNKNQLLKGSMNKIQQQLALLNNNFTMKVRQLRQAQNQKATLDRRIKDLEVEIQQYQSHSQSGKPDVRIQKISEQYQRKLSIMQKQIQITQNQLKIIQEQQHNILSEKTKLQTEVKKLQLIIGQGNKQIQIIQMHKENLMKQNKQLKMHMGNIQTQGFSTKSETVRLRQKIEEYEIIIQDLRVALRNQQNVSRLSAQKIGQLQKSVEQESMNNKQVFQDNKQLKLLVSSLQRTKSQLFQKYKVSAQQRSLKEQDRIEYIKQYNKLLQENKQVLQKLRKKQCALLELNNEYDHLQNIVDDKTEQNIRLLENIKKLQKQLSSYDRSIGQRQMNLQGQHNQIKNLQRQIQKTQKMYNMKCQQLNECQILLNRRNLDFQQLTNQINLLVMNNKQYERSSEKDRLKIQQLERKLKDRLGEIDQLRQVSSSTKIQNQQLTQLIRRQKEQFINLKNYTDNVVEHYNSIYEIVTQRDITIKQLESALHHFQTKQSQYLNERNHYDKQLRSLGDQLIKKQEEITRLAQDRDVYRAQVNTSRRNYTGNTDWKILYQQKIQSLQNQISIKKRQCQSLKIQLRRFQKLIQSEREKIFYLEEELRKSKINDSSNTPIKMFYKSQVQSQNWNGYNRDFIQLQKRSQQGKSLKFSRDSNSRIGQSFESQKISLSSKQHYQNLDEITRQYNATINVSKLKR